MSNIITIIKIDIVIIVFKRYGIINNHSFEFLRSKELNYLTKFLPQTKNGQTKTILVSGDDGIGKTHLLEEFIDISKRSNCQIIYLRNFKYKNIASFYKALLMTLEVELDEIINNTLLKINSIYDEKLNWTETELKNALNIVKLQYSVNPNITSEHIARSIKGSMRLFSRIKPELDGSIDILSEILTDPWIIIASNYRNPADEIFRSSLELADQEYDSSISDKLYKENLLNLFRHINNQIKQKDTALVIVIDHFEDINDTDHYSREVIKKNLSAILEEINKNLDMHIMVVVSCASTNQSIVIGGDLFTDFTNKLLVGPLCPEATFKMSKAVLESKMMNNSNDIVYYFSNYSKGSPFWVNKAINFTDNAAKTINLKNIEISFLRKFLPQNVEEILNSQLSLISSSFSDNLELFDKILKAMVTYKEPISVYNISKHLGVSELEVQQVLDGLVNTGLLRHSNGNGYFYDHSLTKDFLINTYKNRDYFNATLLNLLKLLNVINNQILEKEDPSFSIGYLKDLCLQNNQSQILDQLFRLLESSSRNIDPDIKISTIKGLKELLTEDAINVIAKLINDPSYNVKCESIKALESVIISLNINNSVIENIITALKAAMFDKEPSIRFKAIDILGKIQTKSSLDALINLLKDNDDNIRSQALKNLGKVSSDEYYYLFLEKMTDSSNKVRIEAAEQLGKYRTRQSIKVLCAGLEDPDKNVRRVCAQALGKLQYPETVISLVEAINDPDEDVKINIIKSLGSLKNRRAIPYLKEVLSSPDNNEVVYWVATRALGDIPCKESLEILDEFVNSTNPIIQHAALCSVQKVKATYN